MADDCIRELGVKGLVALLQGIPEIAAVWREYDAATTEPDFPMVHLEENDDQVVERTTNRGQQFTEHQLQISLHIFIAGWEEASTKLNNLEATVRKALSTAYDEEVGDGSADFYRLRWLSSTRNVMRDREHNSATMSLSLNYRHALDDPYVAA